MGAVYDLKDIYENEEIFRKVVKYNFGRVITYSNMLEKWHDNKEYIRKLFGGKNIISKDLEVKKIRKAELSKAMYEFRRNVNYNIDDYLSEPLYVFMEENVGVEGFRDNVVKVAYKKEFADSDKPSISIPKGMKFARSLREFFGESEEDIEKLREMQDLYSEYRQVYTNGGKGKLSLSIDPMDFLTISDNAHEWSSCHNIQYGEYRCGNFNYMVDCTTIVAYFSDGRFDREYEVLGDCQWNSKRWRMLIHLGVDNQGVPTIIYNKNYPYASDELTKATDDFITSLFDKKYIEKTEFVDWDDKGIRDDQVYDKSCDLTCYIDLGYRNNCHLRISKDVLEDEQCAAEHKTVTIGEPIMCLECGDHITLRGDTGVCDCCTDEWYCEECGGYFYGDDMIYIETEDRMVCYCCVDYHYHYCEECDRYFLDDLENYEQDLYGGLVCTECQKKAAEGEHKYVIALSDVLSIMKRDELSAEAIEKIEEEVSKKIEAKLSTWNDYKVRYQTDLYIDYDTREKSDLEEYRNFYPSRVIRSRTSSYHHVEEDESVRYSLGLKNFLNSEDLIFIPSVIYLCGIVDKTIKHTILEDLKEMAERYEEKGHIIKIDTSLMFFY